ncbi:MAG: GNAT family N-acetyltransferase, partial [Myxococcota bacterium]
MTQWRLEPGTDFDTEAIMALLAEVFAEYDCQLDPVLDTPEHYQPQTRYWDQGGAFFVARSTDNTLLGTVAVHPSDTPHTAQIRTMYVARSWRGRGIAQDLMR